MNPRSHEFAVYYSAMRGEILGTIWQNRDDAQVIEDNIGIACLDHYGGGYLPAVLSTLMNRLWRL